MKRYNERMDFVAHEMAQILQNISNGQPVTLWHIKQAVCAAYLSFYPGKTMYTTSGGAGPFYGPGFAHGMLYYVTCDTDGKASIKWSSQFQLGGPASMRGTPKQSGASASVFSGNTSPSDIYPSFSINPGETKIIIDAFIYFAPNSGYYKNMKGSWRSAREEFGFYVLSPKPGRSSQFYFEKFVVFTPKPGLFSETPPK